MYLADTNITIGGIATWLTILVAVIPAGAAIVAAVVAARSARAVKRSEAENDRIRNLENRISERKYETYKPMLEMLGNVFSQAKTSREAIADADANTEKFVNFSTWITVFGSDEAFSAYHNLTQSFNYSPPIQISLRLVADFILAARKDIGYPDTDVTRMQLTALRLNDFYQQGELLGQVMALPLEQACMLVGWPIPWSSMNARPPATASADSTLTPPTQPPSSLRYTFVDKSHYPSGVG
jgi:hypothetical protein